MVMSEAMVEIHNKQGNKTAPKQDDGKTADDLSTKSTFALPEDSLSVERDFDADQRSNLINGRPKQEVTKKTDPTMRVDTHQDAEYQVSLASPNIKKPDHEWVDPRIAKQHLETNEQAHTRITPTSENLNDGIERIWGEKSSPNPTPESRLLESKIKAEVRSGKVHESDMTRGRSQARNSKILAQGAEDEIITTKTSGAFETDLDEYNRFKEQRAKTAKEQETFRLNTDQKAGDLQKQAGGAFSLVPKGAEDLEFSDEETQAFAAQIHAKTSTPHIIQGLPEDSTPATPILSAAEEEKLMNSPSQGLILDDDPYAGMFDDHDGFTPDS